MRTIVYALLAFVVAVHPAAADAPSLEGEMAQFSRNDPALPAPETGAADAGGRPVALETFAGRVAVLNFWATWCAPCVREMPSLSRLQSAFDPEDLEVVAISVDRGGAADARPFLDKLAIDNLTLLFDPKMELARALDVRGMPTTFLLDRDGRIAGSLTGEADWSSDEAQELIRHYVRQPRLAGP